MMYLVKTPRIIQKIFPHFIWHIPTDERTVYLTFDDGPIPEITPWVLEELARYNALATFFCVGENVEKYPDIFEQIKAAGHTLGNHTYNHLNGWLEGDAQMYCRNVSKCAELVDTPLFRPPYGKLRPQQVRVLRQDYRIVMWDVLSGDFDPKISPQQCLNNVLTTVQNGSIIVFHDNIKAEQNLRYALPRTLETLHKKRYVFKAISPDIKYKVM